MRLGVEFESQFEVRPRDIIGPRLWLAGLCALDALDDLGSRLTKCVEYLEEIMAPICRRIHLLEFHENDW